ncbi:MAG: restriction endonuclease [bacterium]|nr:restriction endonuclease [bacterium]
MGLFGDAPTAGHDPDSSDPLVLVFVLDAEDIPTERPRGDLWSAKWMQRAALACRHLNVPLALVTNGDHLTLVHARADEATGWGTWRASLMSAEPLLLDSFVSMLGARRFAGVPPADTPAALLQESAGTEAEVTGQLGSQVRRAVELLVNAISRADRGVDGALLRDIAAEEVYEAAVTVMMRLVFLLVAEEKELLPVDDNTYRDLYSVRTLRESLERARGEDPEALENSSAAWHRLLATNRAVHAGVRHQALCVRAYGSTLFDPDRFGFLEGRAPGESWRTVSTTPISVTDLDVLAMLDALLILRFRSAAGVTDTRRLSYRNVSVEQIGHIYERLLDHGARRADSVVLGCKGASDNEPEIPLADLEAERINGDEALIAFLTDERANGGHYVGTPRQVAKLLADPVDGQLRAELRAACGGDETLVRRIEPFVNLLRTDLRDRPVVFLPGAVYVTETGRNRDSGTAYTTRELADELVEHALAPLCYSPGPRDTADTAEWRIRPSQEILGLRVCDPAVGSGAILVAACRYLADRLVEAQQGEDDPRAADLATAADDPSRHRAVVEATRLVAERCCYGVDRNPMAVEMAKLSMWLTTVAKDRPFTFLDHRFATGDSLLGIWDIEQLRWLHFDPDVGRTQTMSFAGYADGRDATARLQELLDEVLSLRQRMQDIPSESIADIDRKAALHRQAENLMPVIRATADLVTGAALATAGERNASAALTNLLASDLGLLGNLLTSIGTEHQIVALASVQRRAHQRLNVSRPDMAPERRPLHWPIAFPEVFAEGQRFDAMVANPPFIGGQKISGAAGDDYRNYCVAWMAEGKRGSADLVAYFFLNATRVARSLGYLATNTIAQGDTSEVGLEQVIDRGWTIHRAVSSVQWPGEPTVEIAKLWIDQSEWSCRRILDGRSVVVIDEMLYPGSRIRWRKKRLLENSDKSFMGSTVLGIGFTIEPDHALSLIDHDPGNYDVLYPYLNGKDLNTSPSQEASRWIINFFDWPESRAREYVECFAIIEERVRPTRMTNPNAAARIWWRYWRPAPRLYQAITNLDRVIVVACVSKTVMPMFVAARQVFAHALIVFAYDNYFHLGLLSSSFHYRWVVRYGSTLETRTRYTPSDVFETFPQPVFSEEVAAAAEALDDHRREQLYARMIGVTTLYNRVHDPSDHDRDVRKLRELHVELDRAVGAAYGWRDLQFKHGFHDIRGAGRRFTLAPETADEVLTRLLELNRERYLAERQIASHRPNGLGGRERLTASSFALFGQDDEEH